VSPGGNPFKAGRCKKKALSLTPYPSLDDLSLHAISDIEFWPAFNSIMRNRFIQPVAKWRPDIRRQALAFVTGNYPDLERAEKWSNWTTYWKRPFCVYSVVSYLECLKIHAPLKYKLAIKETYRAIFK
jgi:hypothetical protein